MHPAFNNNESITSRQKSELCPIRARLAINKYAVSFLRSGIKGVTPARIILFVLLRTTALPNFELTDSPNLVPVLDFAQISTIEGAEKDLPLETT